MPATPALPRATRRRRGPGDVLASAPGGRGHRWRGRRARTALVAVVVGGAVAATATAEQRAREAPATTVVAVATRDIAPGTALDDEVTALRRVPDELAPARALPAPQAGRAAPVARRPIGQGEVLVLDDVAGGGRTGLAAALADGQRAVAVPVASAPALEPGHHVDLLGADAVGSHADLGRAEVVVDGAEVLAVAEGEVTVAVAGTEVEALATAVGTGPLVVALRGAPADGSAER